MCDKSTFSTIYLHARRRDRRESLPSQAGVSQTQLRTQPIIMYVVAHGPVSFHKYMLFPYIKSFMEGFTMVSVFVPVWTIVRRANFSTLGSIRFG
jgi:hypothetical protein